MDQQQQTVADETKPQAAVKGGRIAPSRLDEIRLASTSSLDRDESESTRDWGAPAPHRKMSRSPGEWQPISSPNPTVGDRWRLAYEGGFHLRQVPWRACKLVNKVS